MAEPYGGFPPYQKHSRTSVIAAALIADQALSMRERVRRYIIASSGATDEEIQDALAMAANTERPRRRELETHDPPLIRDSGRTRKTRSGREAVVWVACVEQQLALL